MARRLSLGCAGNNETTLHGGKPGVWLRAFASIDASHHWRVVNAEKGAENAALRVTCTARPMGSPDSSVAAKRSV
eukprot:6467157-Prymnesium_polylepis.1